MEEQQPEGTEGAEQPQVFAPDARPSKSNLVDRRASRISTQQSHVRLIEPDKDGQATEETEQKETAVERKKSESERRKSESERRKSESERRKSEGERRKSDAERRASNTERRKSDAERRKSDAERIHREISTISASYRDSKTLQRPSITQSKEGILRRHSDRPSKSRAAVGSTISIRKTQSGYGDFFGGVKAAKFMNTYKLDSDNPFHVERVEKILRDVLTEALDNLTYDADKCPKQAKWASSAIRAKVKEQEYDRYKLVILVTIGEKRYQDMCSVVRFLWDIDRDKYALFVHENMHVYAAAMCFGLYYE